MITTSCVSPTPRASNPSPGVKEIVPSALTTTVPSTSSGSVAPVMLRASPSRSVSLASTLMVTPLSSPVVAVSLIASGAVLSESTSLTPTVNQFSDVPPSLDVASAVRVMSPEKSSGGVMVRPSNSLACNVHVPSPLSVPALITAPSGTPAIITSTTDSKAPASMSAVTSSAIAVSSSPDTFATPRLGASNTGATVTPRVWVMDVVSPLSASVDVAVTDRLISP